MSENLIHVYFRGYATSFTVAFACPQASTHSDCRAGMSRVDSFDGCTKTSVETTHSRLNQTGRKLPSRREMALVLSIKHGSSGHGIGTVGSRCSRYVVGCWQDSDLWSYPS